jgi:hypothetical protein
MKKIFISCLLGTMLCAPAVASDLLALNPDAIAKDIDANGAKKTVQKLWGKDGGRWDSAMRKVATGDQRWLDVAAKLAEGTDAGASEGLEVSLATALPINPKGVLKLIDTNPLFTFDSVCSAPFIEPTDAYLKSYLTKTQKMLKALKDDTVEQKRVGCLTQLDKAASYFASSKKDQ